MKKYSVHQEPEKQEKTSSQAPKDAEGACPDCGETAIKREGNTLICPKCGSEPWE